MNNVRSSPLDNSGSSKVDFKAPLYLCRSSLSSCILNIERQSNARFKLTEFCLVKITAYIFNSSLNSSKLVFFFSPSFFFLGFSGRFSLSCLAYSSALAAVDFSVSIFGVGRYILPLSLESSSALNNSKLDINYIKFKNSSRNSTYVVYRHRKYPL